MTRCVYFLRPVGQEGPVKIGCSIDPARRLASYIVWSPVPLEIAATIEASWKVEWALHAKFAHLHSHHEWFKADPELTATINAVRDGTFDLASLPEPKRMKSPAQVLAWSKPKIRQAA